MDGKISQIWRQLSHKTTPKIINEFYEDYLGHITIDVTYDCKSDKVEKRYRKILKDHLLRSLLNNKKVIERKIEKLQKIC